MSDKLTVVLDDQAVLEYDRNKPLATSQLGYLDKMDEAMEKGINVGKDKIEDPDLQQKSQFVALQLVKALHDENDAVIAASCAYLAKRMPDLLQVVAKTMEGKGFYCELVFDKPYVQQATVQFMKPN